ncbi:hypothetical protein V2J09_011108 [Rumex salicifolius]
MAVAAPSLPGLRPHRTLYNSPSPFLSLSFSGTPRSSVIPFHVWNRKRFVPHSAPDDFSDKIASAFAGSMTSNMTHYNNLHVRGSTSFSALSRRQSYDLNHNVQTKDVLPALNRRQGYDLNHNVQIHDVPPDSGGDLGILRQGPHNWVMSDAPQVDSSNLDGRILSLGHNETASSRWESYACAYGSRLPFPPSRQEASHGPFSHIEYGASGPNPQNLVPSSTIGCLALSSNGNGALPGLISGFDLSASLPSSGQLFDLNQLMSAADESGISWMPRLPSEAMTTSSRQQSTAEENHVGTSSKKSEHVQGPQRRIMHASPSGSFNGFSIAADPTVSSSSRSEHVHDSNAEGKSSLKRSPTVTSDPPRKLIRQHTIGPSRFQVNPSSPQSSVLNIKNSPTTTPLQHTSSNNVPAFTPSPSKYLSIDAHQKTIRTQQIPLSQSSDSYPNSSPAFTIPTHTPLNPSWYHRPSAMSPLHKANPLNSLEIRNPQFGAASNISFSPNLPKALSLPSTAPPHIAAMGKPLSVFGATGNSSPGSNHTLQGSLTISPKKMPMSVVSGKAPAPGPSNRTAVADRAKTVIQRFIERQSSALAAFEKNSAALNSSVTTSSMPYIKRQGLDKLEAKGLKCLLCKRDLAYTPEGPVRITACPPEVAVLPCGHVFHDHCLVAITPRDQRANPPCIPCSMGGTSA